MLAGLLHGQLFTYFSHHDDVGALSTTAHAQLELGGDDFACGDVTTTETTTYEDWSCSNTISGDEFYHDFHSVSLHDQAVDGLDNMEMESSLAHQQMFHSYIWQSSCDPSTSSYIPENSTDDPQDMFGSHSIAEHCPLSFAPIDTEEAVCAFRESVYRIHSTTHTETINPRVIFNVPCHPVLPSLSQGATLAPAAEVADSAVFECVGSEESTSTLDYQEESVNFEPNHTKHHFICSFDGCDKTFKCRSHLDRHERTHLGVRPFQCPIEGCTSLFSRRDNMRMHFKHHYARLKKDNPDDALLDYYKEQLDKSFKRARKKTYLD